MKTGLLLSTFICTAVSLAGCSMYGTALGFEPNDNVISTAAFENNCPPDQVKITATNRVDMGSALYNVEVCGKQMQYRRTGTVIHRADKPIL